MSTSVVPVSTIPDAFDRICVEVPYRIDWSIPQNEDAGSVRVIGLCERRVVEVSRLSQPIRGGSRFNARVVDAAGDLVRVRAAEG